MADLCKYLWPANKRVLAEPKRKAEGQESFREKAGQGSRRRLVQTGTAKAYGRRCGTPDGRVRGVNIFRRRHSRGFAREFIVFRAQLPRESPGSSSLPKRRHDRQMEARRETRAGGWFRVARVHAHPDKRISPSEVTIYSIYESTAYTTACWLSLNNLDVSVGECERHVT